MHTAAGHKKVTGISLVMQVVVMADGQGTIGSQILKPNIKKLRSMGKDGVIGGFAGELATAYRTSYCILGVTAVIKVA